MVLLLLPPERPEHFKGWLGVITRNQALTLLRSRERRPRQVEEAALELALSLSGGPASMEKYRISLLMVTPETSSRVPSRPVARRGSPELHPWGGIDITVSAELAIDTENSFLDEMELLYSDDTAVVQETYVTPSGLNVLISKDTAFLFLRKALFFWWLPRLFSSQLFCPGSHLRLTDEAGYAHCQLQSYIEGKEAGKNRPEGTAAEIGVLEEANDHAYKKDGIGQRAGYGGDGKGQRMAAAHLQQSAPRYQIAE